MVNIEELLKTADDNYEEQSKAGTYQTDPRILKLKIGATYRIRLLLNGKKTVDGKVPEQRLAFNEIGWQSESNGKFIFAGRDPRDIKIKDDIYAKTSWEEYNKAKEAGEAKAPNARYKKLMGRRRELINAYLEYVEGDDEQKAKVGTVVVVKFPAQQKKDAKTGQLVPSSDFLSALEDGLHGSDKDEVGTKNAFLRPDTKENCVFEIKVIEKDKYPNYKCKFKSLSKHGLTAEQIKKMIFEDAHDLREFVPEVKSQEELKKIIDEHYYGKTAVVDDEVETDVDSSDKEDDDLDIDTDDISVAKDDDGLNLEDI